MNEPFELIKSYVDEQTAQELRALYDDDALFRKRVVMERHAFGRGEYKYFANPLPAKVAALREALYARLVPIANQWMEASGKDVRFPLTHQQFLHDCFDAEQKRPTALLLKYGPGDYNCLHQDLYGPVAFPLQATLYLSKPGAEFGGGEVVLTESKARAQTRPHVLLPSQGDLLVLPSSAVPRKGANGSSYRATFKHGVSSISWGTRYALGIIFHDAL